jgi:hypothetical protein
VVHDALALSAGSNSLVVLRRRSVWWLSHRGRAHTLTFEATMWTVIVLVVEDCPSVDSFGDATP